MYQQHGQFEEALHDEPHAPPVLPYQANLSNQEFISSTRGEFPFQFPENELNQKLPGRTSGRKKPANISIRLLLALFSFLFVLVLYFIAFAGMNSAQILMIALFFTLALLCLNIFVHFKIRVSKR